MDILTDVQIGAYLDRIEMQQPIQLNIDGLNRLVQAQLSHIPFDSLDVWGTGCCPSLDLDNLFNKIIVKRRGGYCFELNTLFRILLNSLGFNAYQAISCLVAEDGTAAPPAHNVIICVLHGEKYLIDVGFGGPVPFGAMPLAAECWGDFCLQHRNGWYTLMHKTEFTKPLIQFRDIPADHVELIPLNFYISQRPDSHFRYRPLLNIRKEDGTIFKLVGRDFEIKTSSVTSSRKISTNSELAEILQTYYGIDPAFVTMGRLPD